MLSDGIVGKRRVGWQPLKSAGAEILLAPQMHVCPRRNPAASRRSGVELWMSERLFGRVWEFLSASYPPSPLPLPALLVLFSR